MIRKKIHEWLSATYGLPVVEDITQTKVEKAVGFSLIGEPIDVRILSDQSITFKFGLTLWYRCPNGEACIGFLTLGLSDTDSQPGDFNLSSYEGAEQVEVENTTEMIVSKNVEGFIALEHNKVRELIKCVEMTGGLNCIESCLPTE